MLHIPVWLLVSGLLLLLLPVIYLIYDTYCKADTVSPGKSNYFQSRVTLPKNPHTVKYK
jgi:hypothetical protein